LLLHHGRHGDRPALRAAQLLPRLALIVGVGRLLVDGDVVLPGGLLELDARLLLLEILGRSGSPLVRQLLPFNSMQLELVRLLQISCCRRHECIFTFVVELVDDYLLLIARGLWRARDHQGRLVCWVVARIVICSWQAGIFMDLYCIRAVQGVEVLLRYQQALLDVALTALVCSMLNGLLQLHLLYYG